MRDIFEFLKQLRDDASGNILEYSVIIGLILATMILALTSMGITVFDEFTFLAGLLGP